MRRSTWNAIALLTASAWGLAGCGAMPQAQPGYQFAPQPVVVAPAPQQPVRVADDVASPSPWITYTSDAGEQLRVRYIDVDSGGDTLYYADVQLNGGYTMRFNKVAEEQHGGNPVYADTGDTGMLLVSRGGGGSVVLTRGQSRTVFR